MLRSGTVDPAWPRTGASLFHVDDGAAADLALEDLVSQVEQPLVAEGVEELGAGRFCATIVPVG